MKNKIKLGGKNGIYTKVDEHLYDYLSKFNWMDSGHGYAFTTINGKKKYLHRFLMNPLKNQEVDHINGDSLDNRKFNLRIVNRSQNNANRDSTKGAWFSKQKQKWVAEILWQGKKTHHGLFKTSFGAETVRRNAEIKIFGKYARKGRKTKTVGLTFGVFDLLHEGHINLLQNAKKYVDVLVVCVSNTDYSLEHKNKKPKIRLRKRQKMVYALDCVECVDSQSLKFGKKEAIEKYCPDFLFVGSDHKGIFTGEGLGVPVIYLPRTKGISSTQLRNQ